MRVLLIAIALAGGCATTGVPKCPREGGPPWRAVETEHFIVYGEGSAAAAADVALDLEFVRAAVAHFLLPGWDGPPGQIPVVALGVEHHFEEYFPKSVAGAYTELLAQPLILMSGTKSMSQLVVVKHELAHYLVDAFVPMDRLPRWVGEGIATYIETMDVDRKGGRVTVGKSVDDRVIFALARYYPQRIMMQYRVELLLLGEAAFYGQSWLKVHYLINEHGPAFGEFLARLRAGDKEAEAWKSAFPDLPAEQLDARLTEYVQHGKYRVMTLKVFADKATPVERELDDADVHAWRGALYALRAMLADAQRAEDQKKDDTTRAEIVTPEKVSADPADKIAVERGLAETAEALRQDPAHVLANAVETLLGRDLPAERARQITVAHGDSWLAWYLLSDSLKKDGDDKAAWEALKEALRRSAANPSIRLMQKIQKGTADKRSGGHS